MIVREIKTNPTILNDFDWFNDYNDTRAWAVQSAPELVSRLDEGYQNWIQAQRRKL